MSSPLSQLRAAATVIESFGGFDFEVHRVTNRELVGLRRYQLMVARVPSETEALVAQQWAKEVLAGGDALDVYRRLSAEQRTIAMEGLSSEAEEAAEEMRGAVLAAAVRRWRPTPEEGAPEPAWRPCRIVYADGEGEEGDGATTPDVVPVQLLPGGPVLAQHLTARAIAMSGMSEVEAARLRTFRAGR